MPKIVSTARLTTLNLDAIKRHYNRAIADEAVARLDPDGLHLVTVIILHNDSEYRCRVLMKFTGDDEPHEVYLDVHPGNYRNLTDLEDK